MDIRKAQAEDAAGIQKVCAVDNPETYHGLLPKHEIERVIEHQQNSDSQNKHDVLDLGVALYKFSRGNP